MAKKLREGLIEPHDLGEEDLRSYMQTTYCGYMTEIRERIISFRHAQQVHAFNGGGLFGRKNVDTEFFGIQVRMIMELLAYAVSTFEQASLGKPVTQKKRNIYQPTEILKSIKTQNLWIKSIDPNCNIFEAPNTEIEVRFITTRYTTPANLTTDYGKLGNILHAEQRPRIDQNKKVQMSDIFMMFDRLELSVTKHIIGSKTESWLIDTTQPGEDLGVSMYPLNLIEPNNQVDSKITAS